MKSLICQCFWSDRDGSTTIQHVADGGEIRLCRDEEDTKLWVCMRCNRTAQMLKVALYQGNEEALTEFSKTNGGVH